MTLQHAEAHGLQDDIALTPIWMSLAGAEKRTSGWAPEVAARERSAWCDRREAYTRVPMHEARGPTPRANEPVETASDDLQEEAKTHGRIGLRSRAALEKAIAGPAIDMARLVDGAKPQKPHAARP